MFITLNSNLICTGIISGHTDSFHMSLKKDIYDVYGVNCMWMCKERNILRRIKSFGGTVDVGPKTGHPRCGSPNYNCIT